MEEHALLIIQDQPKNEQWEHPLSEDVVEIGRDPGCGLTLPDRQVSRHHATIYRRGGQYMLRDEGSRNGTLLNGQMMRLPYALHDGDEIRLAARYRLIFVASEA
ncbi:MAG: FHA domain-containing protein, partial [Chloroflexia bacterium]|nr:FHA domain-containing protein [Chloroflexia bacterium]